ncbi:MAG: VOC family protein [Tepidiformaceae bacterium]
MKPKLSLLTLGVADLERSRVFYRDGLDLPVFRDLPEVIFFQLEGTWLAIWSRESLAEDAHLSSEGGGFRGFAIAHNVPSRAAVDEVLAQAADAGATITKPAIDAPWGGYSGYFTDPDGFLWEVAWNPDFDLT